MVNLGKRHVRLPCAMRVSEVDFVDDVGFVDDSEDTVDG